MISVLQTGNVYEFRGLSTDTKPTNVTNGCCFIEMDTGKVYLFNKTNVQWLEFGAEPTPPTPPTPGILTVKFFRPISANELIGEIIK